MIGTNDLEKAKAFYDALLGTLGVAPATVDRHRIFYRTKTGVFSVSKPINGQPATPANGGTIGFACSSPQQAPGTPLALPTAGPPAKTRRVCAKYPQASSM
jgi:catechol 2,3-dioxygenase-like lactoylglutathione lyase family enzyme